MWLTNRARRSGWEGFGQPEDFACPFGNRKVYELSARQTKSGSVCVVERLDDLTRPLQFVVVRAEGSVNDRQLRGVDRRLAEEPERAADRGLPAKPVGVLQVGVDAVDGRLDSRCPRGDYQV